MIIRTSKGASNIENLLHGTSILYFKASIANPVYREPQPCLNIYSLPEALIECSPDFFKLDSIAARTCLSMVSDVGDILIIVLEKGQTTKAGRLAGAFRNIGYASFADCTEFSDLKQCEKFSNFVGSNWANIYGNLWSLVVLFKGVAPLLTAKMKKLI